MIAFSKYVIVQRWPAIPATIKVTIVFVELSQYSLIHIFFYRDTYISNNKSNFSQLPVGVRYSCGVRSRLIAKDVKYESSSDRSGAQCGIPSRYYSGCWICNTTIKISDSYSHSLFRKPFLLFCFALHFLLFFFKLDAFAFTCFKNEWSIFTDYLDFQVIAFTSHKASCRSCVGGKMYHKIISMI